MKKYTFTEEELKEMQKHEWAFNAYISKKNFDNGAFTCQIWFAAIDEYAKKNNIMPVCRRAPGEPICTFYLMKHGDHRLKFCYYDLDETREEVTYWREAEITWYYETQNTHEEGNYIELDDFLSYRKAANRALNEWRSRTSKPENKIYFALDGTQFNDPEEAIEYNAALSKSSRSR